MDVTVSNGFADRTCGVVDISGHIWRLTGTLGRVAVVPSYLTLLNLIHVVNHSLLLKSSEQI